MARFCGKCGAAANEKATFCNKCGNRLLQKKAIRFGHGDASAPENPYRSESAAPQGPIGVMPPVAKPGKKGSSTPTPPPVYSAPDAPTAGKNPYASSAAPSPYVSAPTPSASSSSDSASRLDEAPPFAALEEDTLTRARSTVKSFALWSAGIVLFPLPFTSLVALIPVQTAMILSLSKIFKVQEPPEKILAYIAATSGITVFGQVTMLIVSELVPILGKLVSAPFIYGWTYGLGEVAIRYFESQGQISGDEMKQVFKQASRQAKTHYKAEKKVSKEESLQALQEHLAPEEYDRLRQKFGGT